MTTQLIKEDTPIIPLSECKRFITECLEAVGTPKEHAQAQADLLIEADYRGHYSHGMNRLELYINDINNKLCNPSAKPETLKENAATAWVDGRDGLGSVVGNFCMELAIKKAKTAGVGWVVCGRSNHFGIVGKYTLQALNEGLIGMAFTNASPIVVPVRAKEPAYGTSPISVAAAGKDGDSFVLDMATSAVAIGKIEMQVRKNEPIPKGWALDEEGNVTTDSKKAVEARRLLPLGGIEETAGYKGYGLGIVGEIFCAILSGSTYGPYVRHWNIPNPQTPCDLSHCFVAVDPENFAPGFQDRLQDLMNYLRSMEPVDRSKPVLIPGDPERIHMKAVDKAGGIRYVRNQLEVCKRLAETYNVRPLQPLH